MRQLLVVLALAVSLPVLAADFERVLVPVFVNFIQPGAFGSQWVTQLSMHNAGARPVLIDPIHCTLLISPCPPFALWPNDVWRFGYEPVASAPVAVGNEGPTFLYVPAEDAPNVHFGLVVKDISRLDQTYGTEIPVVPASEFRTTKLSLLNIPVQPPFRSTLRLYNGERTATTVRVRVFPFPPGSTIVERDVTLPAIDYPTRPGYAEIGDLFDDAQRMGFDVAHVEILPSSIPIWGFVSVTNNATQQVTVVTPQPAR